MFCANRVSMVDVSIIIYPSCPRGDTESPLAILDTNHDAEIESNEEDHSSQQAEENSHINPFLRHRQQGAPDSDTGVH